MLKEVIVTDLVPMRVRGKWFGVISLAWAIGTAGGPLIGGLLAENDSWVNWELIFADASI